MEDMPSEGTIRSGLRRREGRGLGPFTSGHLTVIVVTLLVLVGFPFAAYAVTGSSVFVTDSTSGTKAHVDAKGDLNVGIHDPTSGTGAKVNSSGQLTVSGPVTANVAYPTSAIVHTDDGAGDNYVIPDSCGSGTCRTMLKPPSGQAAVITTVHIDTADAAATGGNEYLDIARSNNGTCTLGSEDRLIEVFTPAVVGETALSYDMPGGLPVPAGDAMCVYNSDPTNLAFYVMAYGYDVRAGTVPANAPKAGALTGLDLLKLHKP
jgi:hypothetical protein